MRIIISPSKTMQFVDLMKSDVYPDDSYKKIYNKLKRLSKNKLGAALGVKGNILEATYSNIKNFEDLESNMAIKAYTGFVFKGLEINSYSKKEWDYLSDNLRIVSAFYGLLHPTSMIKPYRLDYKAKVGIDLYSMREFSFDETVINLASGEFSKAVKSSMITIGFRDLVNGSYINKATYAKQARGVLLNYLIMNQVKSVKGIKEFSELGYCYNPDISDEESIIFTR